MSLDLNATLELWLDAGGAALQKKIAEEVGNRLDHYPAIGEILRQRPIDIPQLTAEALACWVLNRFKKIRLNAFVQDEGYAREFVTNLIDG